MNIYKTQVSMQNFGSSLLVILRGAKQDVEETFNSFYNWKGTNGSLQLEDNNSSWIGTFWSRDAELERYWQNRFCMANLEINSQDVYAGNIPAANSFVESNMTELKGNQEIFINYSNSYTVMEHSLGRISDVRADDSFRDQALAYGFSDKSAKNGVQKETVAR